MKIALIGAMKEEVNFALTLLSDIKEKNINNFCFYEGKYKHHDIVVVESGIGKVSAGLLIATIALSYPDIQKYINIGVSGGVKEKVKVGDIVVNSQAIYGDVDVRSGGGYLYGQMCRFPQVFQGDQFLINLIKEKIGLSYYIGTVLTSDKFVTSYEETNKLINDYFIDKNVLCFDMESAAFAQGCHFFKKDFLSIRAISDVVGENNNKEFDENLDHACKMSNDFVFNLLDNI